MHRLPQAAPVGSVVTAPASALGHWLLVWFSLWLSAALIFWNIRSTAADTALGAALDVYTTPLAAPGAPPETDIYTTAAERAKEANREFVAIAHDFGWLPEGREGPLFRGRHV